MQIAQTILEQLGGRRFIAMTGATNLLGGDRSLSMKIGRNDRGVTHVRVTLNVADLYDVEFLAVRGTSIKRKSSAIALYADRLRDVFTEHTGLYTSL